MLLCWETTFLLLLPCCQDWLLRRRLWLFGWKDSFCYFRQFYISKTAETLSALCHVRFYIWGKKLQNILTALMHIFIRISFALSFKWSGHLIMLTEGDFFPLHLWSQKQRNFFVKKKKKRWSTYPRMLFAGAAAHVLSCFVARQRHTGLELVGVFCFKGIWEEVVWLAFKVSLADSLLTLHYAEGSINASFSDSFFACCHGY